MLPVQLEHAAAAVQVNGAVPHADPVELVPLNMHRHQGGAAAAGELLIHAVADGVGALPEPLGHRHFLCPLPEGLAEGGHRALAGLLSVRHAAHAVGHHGQQTLSSQGGGVGGVQDGEGVLLPLPQAHALDVAHPEGQACFRQRHGRRIVRHTSGAAEHAVKQSHGPSPRPSR